MGLEIFDAASGEEYEQIFLQYEWELEEYLGKEWEQMEPEAIVRRLVANLFLKWPNSSAARVKLNTRIITHQMIHASSVRTGLSGS
jgi:hypothetical protein